MIMGEHATGPRWESRLCCSLSEECFTEGETKSLEGTSFCVVKFMLLELQCQFSYSDPWWRGAQARGGFCKIILRSSAANDGMEDEEVEKEEGKLVASSQAAPLPPCWEMGCLGGPETQIDLINDSELSLALL